jgi:DNA transformation protein and related proteins
MNELTNLPNIGKTLTDKLYQTGISSFNELKSVGSENAFIRLKTIDTSSCLNMLYAIEGAFQGIRWHNLDKSKMTELKEFYDHLK